LVLALSDVLAQATTASFCGKTAKQQIQNGNSNHQHEEFLASFSQHFFINCPRMSEIHASFVATICFDNSLDIFSIIYQ
jgi:hypothetical protein